jgi:hypothetical protein
MGLVLGLRVRVCARVSVGVRVRVSADVANILGVGQRLESRLGLDFQLGLEVRVKSESQG